MDARARKQAPSFEGHSPSSERASRTLARVRSEETTCEKQLRRELWRLGLRYRIHYKGLPGKPDIVFPSAKVAVFCDGDFWHGREWQSRERRLRIGANSSYWTAKIRANIARDKRNTLALRKAGWAVIRAWESDIARDSERIAASIADLVTRRRSRDQNSHG